MPKLALSRRWLVLAGILIVLLAALPFALSPLAAAKLHSTAAAKHLRASWRTLRVNLPASLEVRDLVLVRDEGDTLLTAGTLAVRASLGSVLLLHPHVAEAHIDAVTLRLHGAPADADSLGDDTSDNDAPAPAVAEKVRHAATQFAQALLAPARALPTLRVTRMQVTRGDSSGVTLDGLTLERTHDAVDLMLAGTLHRDDDVPFDAQLHWKHDDALEGRGEFRLPDGDGHTTPLTLTIAGRVTQDRHAGQLRIAPGTRVTVGDLALGVNATVDTHGPRFTAALTLDSLTAERVQSSLPRAVLGPLADMSVRGSWDWHVSADLDLAMPDSVRFSADVIPHGLALDEVTSNVKLAAIAQPFTATIHLPKGRLAHRELSPANPHFRPLDRISPYLRDALVTNEDGAFFVHRGFNTEAIQLAIAANLRAGSYKRGAGTITMQLVRNLFLGHQRTLSRKGQEVTLAWMLEHLTGIPKQRLLEIYLNIIEWGPEVHGADEAAHWYFDRDAADLTLPEALFLTIVVPSPSKWRWRVTNDGALRSYAQAQMHFIANKMAAKGWLDPALVPPADSLRIELRGPARAVLQGLAPAAAPADSSANTPL